MCSVAFQPTAVGKAYGYYSAPGPTTPVRRLAIHFGAPGDRTDAAGNLWLGFPRPTGSLVLPLKIPLTLMPGGGYMSRNSTYTPVAGANDPWLFASAVCGMARCMIPLLEPGDGKSVYRVRLLMSDPDQDRAGQRVFDVKMQGKVVLRGCDIAGESGGRDRVLIKEVKDIEVVDGLLIELVPKGAGPAPRATADPSGDGGDSPAGRESWLRDARGHARRARIRSSASTFVWPIREMKHSAAHSRSSRRRGLK